MRTVTVVGVHINLDQLGSFKNLKELKSKGDQIFDHLSGEEKDKAYDELWKVGYSTSTDQPATPAPGIEAADAAPVAE